MSTLSRLALNRPIAVVVVWAILVTAAAPFAGMLGGALRGSTDAVPGSPSELTSRRLDAAYGEGAAFVFPAVLTSTRYSTDHPAFSAATAHLERALTSAGMRRVQHHWNTGTPDLLGRDGHSALLLVTPPASTFFDAEEMVDSIRAVAATANHDSEFEMKLTGMVSLFHDLDVNASGDLLRAERIGIPLVLLVLLIVFRAPLAAALPLLLAVGATTCTLAILFGLSRLMPVSVFAQNVVTMVGLGVGVDYALFLISRCRDELRRGLPFPDAVDAAVGRTAHVILVSGLAVCAGFLSLLVVRVPFLRTLALGGVVVVSTAVLMTLTLLPALLLLIGERVNWPHRVRATSHPLGGLWARWAHEAMTRPWRYLAPAVAIIAVLVLPTLRLQAWNVGAHDLSPTMEARQGYDLLEGNFAAGWMGPIVLLLESRDPAPLVTPERQQAIGAAYSTLVADSRVHGASIVPSPDGRSVAIYLVPRSAPESPEVMELVRELRSTNWAQLTAAGIDTYVGGSSASILDFDEELFSSLRRVVPMVLAITFLVLAYAFRSIVVPLKAITMNLVSVLAAYGFLVYLFQDGIGASLIGLDPPGGLNSFIVLMLFTILFGLSMDYEVFLLTRVQEEYRRSGDNRGSVAKGLSETGGVITSAALIMVVLFGSFGFTELTATREFGLGLAFAVAFDATLIRVVLVPVLMGLLGRANWWWPGAGRSGALKSVEPAPLGAVRPLTP